VKKGVNLTTTTTENPCFSLVGRVGLEPTTKGL
jgi:hypothetical protein